MPLKVGNDLKLYYNSGTHASPVWVEVNMVGDVTVNISCNEAEVDLRVSNWLLNLPAKLSGSIDLTLANHPGGTAFDYLRTMALARTTKQFASATGAMNTNDVEYFKAFAFFSAFPWGQATQDMSSHDASLSLAYHEESNVLVEPSWGKVSGY